MIEMEMRIDDEINLALFDILRSEPRREFVARLESDLMNRREASEPCVRIGLRIDVKAGLENDASLRMLDQVRRHRYRLPVSPARSSATGTVVHPQVNA